MWIFLLDGFISVVAHRDSTELLLVRARRPEVLLRMFPDLKIDDTTGSDYKYRALVPRTQFKQVISQEVVDLNYSNFKSSVYDSELSELYHEIWELGLAYQR